MSLKKSTQKYIDHKCPCDLSGKTVLITGSNSGVGFKTAETMIYLHAKVILACRNTTAAENARKTLLSDYPDAEIGILRLDLASFASIDDFVKKIIEKNIDIDCFVNNAGVFHKPNEKTADGIELVIGTNYIGTAYMTKQILPYLKALQHKVTYINTVSIIQKNATVDFNDFYYSENYEDFKVYARSKLAIARMTNAYIREYSGSNIKILMNHPGMSVTPLGLNAFGKTVKYLGSKIQFLFNSPEKSSLSVAYILSHDVPEGSLVGPRGLFNGWGYPSINKPVKRANTDTDVLMQFTEKELEKLKNK